MKKILRTLCGCLPFIVFSAACSAQSPGQIVRPAVSPYSAILDPDQNGYTSLSTSGFVTSDIGTGNSEINYLVVPPIITEPTGDLATGPSGGFTDIVKTVDNSGFYVYSNGTNIYFRLRIGGIISGSKGYSILIDTDGKMGNSGPYADPDYVAPTNTSNGNPGFEYEVVYETNFQVQVFNVNGTANPVSVATYSLNTNSQISVALSTDGNNPDYFYDWFVPLSAIGSPSSIRMAATTVTSPNSALQGSRSDIYGIDDATSSASTGWTTVINAQPPISIGGGGISSVAPPCTAPPTLNSPIIPGSSVSVGGTWTRMDVSKPSTATITLYKNGTAVNTTSVTSGNSWTIAVPTVASGDVFYAKAQATGESQCLQSNNVTAGCSSTPSAPSFSNSTINACASSKGMRATVPLGATVEIYEITTANYAVTSTLLTTGLIYTNLASERQFDYYGGNPQSGNACDGQSAVFNTASTFMLLSNLNGCKSAPVFGCIASGGNHNSQMTSLSSNSIALTTPIYPYQTTISGTGSANGQVLRLFINNEYKAGITATGSSFSFPGVILNSGDQLKVYAQTSGSCMTVSGTTTVSCYLPPPVITTNTAGNLLAGATSVTGTSAYPGATVTLYKGTSPTGVSQGSATVTGSGAWTLSVSALTAADNYYATQIYSGCTSPASSQAAVATVTTICPAFGSATYASNASSISGTLGSSFTGTVRLYLDGVQIGSASITAATSWTINSPFTYPLYPGAILSATTQSSGAAEKTDCNASATISCTSPSTPTVSPLSTTINTGQAVTYSISNVNSNTWYAVMDNTGNSYATSIYSTNTSNFSLTTKTFNSTGTYSLKLSADELSGCPSSYRTVNVVVNPISLPVTFINVAGKKMINENIISWTVGNEVNVAYYEIERSYDCRNFSSIGKVPYNGRSSTTNQYTFIDNSVSSGRACYRIRQVDDINSYHLSQVIAISGYNIKTSLAPNPATDQTILYINNEKDAPATVQLMDLNSKVIIHRSVFLYRGANAINLRDLLAKERGMYIVKVYSQDEAHYLPLILK